MACSDPGTSPPCEVSLAVRMSEPNPLANADKLQTFIFAAGQAVFGDEVDIPGEGGVVPLVTPGTDPKIDLSEDFEIVVAGLRTGATEVLASGRTPEFACTGDEEIEVPLYVGPANGFATPADSATPRRGATATPLPDGRVLIVGGESLDGSPVAPVIEIYDHTSGLFCSESCVSGIIPARIGHTATATGDGRVLIVGGEAPGGAILGDAYLFDAASGVLTNVDLGVTLVDHAAVALVGEAIPAAKRGKVLVVGGQDTSGPTGAIRLVDVDAGTAVEVAQLVTARYSPTATLLSNGEVLIVGGLAAVIAVSSVESFDAINDTMRSDVVTGACPSPGGLATASMCAGRVLHSATLLEDDNVLFWGGILSVVIDGADPAPRAEVWVNEERRFYPATTDAATYDLRHSHTATRVPCFRPPCPVLVLGGDTGSAVVPESLMFSSSTGTVSGGTFAGVVTPLVNVGALSQRAEHAALALADGSILAVGGRRADSSGMVFDATVFSRCEIIVALEGVECPEP